jgi:dTDP-4-amino-4,6-dideoxygalactose transaminase
MAALQAVGIGPGDEVITTPFTFVATLNAILHVGATARFADIDVDDLLLRPDAVEALISPRTRAIMPVHLYGQMADMGAIGELADRHGLAIVEDAAQAHGATCDGRPAGSYGVGSFSLYATKNITTGEGGVITTDDHRIADTLRLLRNQGMRSRYQYELIGHNLRLTDLQAAVGVPQLERLDDLIAARRSNAGHLDAGLADVPGLRRPVEREGRRHVYHQYTVRLDDTARCSRDQLAEALTQRGVGSGVYYPRVAFDYECFRGHRGVVIDDVPAARQVAAQVLSLPVHPHLTDSELDQVVSAVRAVLA